MTELAPYDWVMESFRDRFVGAFTNLGFQPKITATTDDVIAIQTLVSARLGISLMSEMALYPCAAGRGVPAAAPHLRFAVAGHGQRSRRGDGWARSVPSPAPCGRPSLALRARLTCRGVSLRQARIWASC
ncbi:LysR family transcriptional regulator substrate-binding protein [Streptomyces sp. NBC_00365]|uniref:LysR family transcriptional regulator substrate-binding protein n=1 Tax=Streptomyces sp. NBC_00365 TaxID=2975726 RepID=UPI00338F2F01